MHALVRTLRDSLTPATIKLVLLLLGLIFVVATAAIYLILYLE